MKKPTAERMRLGMTYEEACPYADPALRGTRVTMRGKSYQVRAAIIEVTPRSRAVMFNLEGEDGQTICGIHHSLVSLASQRPSP